MKIAPSVLACDFSRLREEAAAMQHAGAELLHLDVMDGCFVPNISFGAPVIAALRPHVRMVFDVHLMIDLPHRYIPQFAAAGADIITFHVEAGSPVTETIELIRGQGAVPGLVLKPSTPADAVYPYLDKIGMVLVMTVEPGFGGQSFMPEMLPKISDIRARAPGLDIQVDGGVTTGTIGAAAKAGANVFVAGSALFGQRDYAKGVAELRKAATNSNRGDI